MRVVFAGDIVGNQALKAVANWVQVLKEEKQADIFIVNGENAAGGNGLTVQQANLLLDAGVDCITMGNHTWGHWALSRHIDKEERIIRPGNVPQSWPGNFVYEIQKNSFRLRVVNLLGQAYLSTHSCPFEFMEDLWFEEEETIPTIVDFHAEASAEKLAMAWFCDGQVSALIGTHTHVQTADERIFPEGLAYISDVGMCGPINGVIGMDKDQSLRRFIDKLPANYKIAEGPLEIRAVLLEIDEDGRASSILRVHLQEMYENEWQGNPPAILPIIK